MTPTGCEPVAPPIEGLSDIPAWTTAQSLCSPDLPRRLIVLTMTMAGLLVGLAGAINLLGLDFQMTPGYDTTVGFDAITVALLGRSNPVGVLFSALLLGGMRAGAGAMQIQAGVPRELVDLLQAIILLFLVINPLRRFLGTRALHGTEMAGLETVTRTYVRESV